MSPDDATSIEPEPAAAAEEAVPKKSMKDRMAFMTQGGDKMEKVPGINKVPKSMRVLVVILIVVVIIVAISAVAMMGGSDKKPEPNGTNNINPAKLEDIDLPSGPMAGTASEFSETTMTLESVVGENQTLLVDMITMTLEWQDEPDQTWAGRVRENSPDSFQLRIDIGNGNYTVESEMTANGADKSGSVSLSMDLGLSNFTYVLVGNATDTTLPEDIVDMGVSLVVIMGEAGDLYASGPAAFKLNDFGNDYTLNVAVSGKVVPAN